MESRSVLLEDDRFREVRLPKKKHIPAKLHWFLGEEYFSGELLSVYPSEVRAFKAVAEEAFDIFLKATDHIIEHKGLEALGIPALFHPVIEYTWKNRDRHSFLLGRFDINGVFDRVKGKVIEFNADTMSSIPETIKWQEFQRKQLGENEYQFNELAIRLEQQLRTIRSRFPGEESNLTGSSFGYIEDQLNIDAVMEQAYKAGFLVQNIDVPEIIFSEEGVFYEAGSEYQRVDVWYKMAPWDWTFNEEPGLAQILSDLIMNELVLVLNPPYTAIWQNKRFLAYITEHFPNDVIAKTYLERPTDMREGLVEKPIYGRIGENIVLHDPDGDLQRSQGDFGDQPKIYQEYLPLAVDEEKHYYQAGVFMCDGPAALNLRCQESKIMTDDCEFMSHVISEY